MYIVGLIADGMAHVASHTPGVPVLTVVIASAVLLAPWVALWIWRGARPGELRKFAYWARWAAVPVVVLAVWYFFWGAVPNPQFTLSNLKGLTPSQVIARLGSPTDRRYSAPPNTVDQSALTFDYEDPYRWSGFSYSVIFGKNNRVKWVLVGSH